MYSDLLGTTESIASAVVMPRFQGSTVGNPPCFNGSGRVAAASVSDWFLVNRWPRRDIIGGREDNHVHVCLAVACPKRRQVCSI